VSLSQPAGLSRQVNRALLTATLVVGVAAFVALVILAGTGHGRVAPSVIYGLSLVACSLCSFLYNMMETATRRRLLRHLDHAAIFLLIAGTYTPFAATGIRGPFHGSLLAWVWSLALLGIGLKLVLPQAYDRAFVGLYLAIGWLLVTALDDVVRLVPPLSLALLALGGLAYTIGAIIYARDIGRWTDPVWHGCVLAGSLTQFFAVVALGLSPAAT
jgi:hemolysin III